MRQFLRNLEKAIDDDDTVQ